MLWMRQMAPRFGKRLDANVLARALGIAEEDIDPGFPIEEVSTGFPTLIVPLRNLDALKRAKVDKNAYFALVTDAWAKLILVFSREGYEPGQRLSVRMFADYYGIAEDAATGSSNGCQGTRLAGDRRIGRARL
jgi:trans-2,3-dihydro-3-hydroxyanthranilate isomerase